MPFPWMAAGAAIGKAAIAQADFWGTTASAKKAAKKANDFTREMMKNRHQWEIRDLKKAGLNPILSAGGTPSMGSAAQAQIPRMHTGDLVEAAVGGATAKSKVKQAKEAAFEKKMQGSKAAVAVQVESEILENLYKTGDNIKGDTALKVAQARDKHADAQLKDYQAVAAGYQAREVDTSAYGKAMMWSDRLMRQIPALGIGLGGMGRGMRRTPKPPKQQWKRQPHDMRKK